MGRVVEILLNAVCRVALILAAHGPVRPWIARMSLKRLCVFNERTPEPNWSAPAWPFSGNESPDLRRTLHTFVESTGRIIFDKPAIQAAWKQVEALPPGLPRDLLAAFVGHYARTGRHDRVAAEILRRGIRCQGS